MESGGFAVPAFWCVRPESLTRSVHSVAGRDQTQLPSRFRGTALFMCFPAVAPPWGSCKDIGGLGGGRGHTHSRGGAGGYLPERCCAPQGGQTPLHCAAHGGYAAVVEPLLAAGAAVDAKNTVRG